MKNIAKYFVLLETLQNKENNASQSTKAGNNNEDKQKESTSTLCGQELLECKLQVLKKFVKLDENEVLSKLALMLNIPEIDGNVCTNKIESQTSAYIAYMEYVLLELTSNINFDSDAKEDLVSTRHLNLCIEAVQDVSEYGLRNLLHPVFQKSAVFKTTQNTITNYGLLHLSVEFSAKMLTIKQFHISNSMELVLRDLMAAIFSLIVAKHENVYNLEECAEQQLKKHLNYIWVHLTKLEYFRNILLLKATPQLPVQLQKLLHQQMLQKLTMTDGFTTLVATIHSSQRASNVDSQQVFEIVANIVAFRGQTQRFQKLMIKQVFEFCILCVKNEGMLDSMGAGLLTLRRLYDLSLENRVEIQNIIAEYLKDFIAPTELLSGLISMDHNDFVRRIQLLYQLFCTSIVACLPSVLLIDYLPMLLQIFDSLPRTLTAKQQLCVLIIRCLDNREPTQELPQIIESLYTTKYPQSWQMLHERLQIMSNAAQTEVTLKVTPLCDSKSIQFSVSLVLCDLLMSSANANMLTYKIFMILLQLMAKQLAEHNTEEQSIELLTNEAELIEFLNAKYPTKVEILLTLNTLNAHPALRAQLAEHKNEFLRFLRDLLQQRFHNSNKNTEETDQTLLIVLTLLHELLEETTLPDVHRDFIQQLRQLRQRSPNRLVQQRIDLILSLLGGEFKANVTPSSNAFNSARTLIESKESHLQVYGIQMLLTLLREKDDVALSQTHVIIALALSMLKTTESYTFLNCVRLFVTLVNVMEAEVLDVLTDEYLSDNVSLDYRLVVGEAILKVANELGPLCYKYKEVLVNCFINGVRSPTNEFRMSAYANLAQISRILSYQVHNFFQEILNIIDAELSTGQYLPTKRAAVLVLAELLAGMDDLVDYEEMLLPIYRLLCAIEAAEDCDAKMRLHAANGLKILNEKCRKLLFPTQEFEKKIQIFGLNDKPKNNRKPHILEIN